MISPTVLLARAFEPNDPGIPAEPLPPGSVCAISGEPIEEGVRVDALVTPTTARPHEIFRVRRATHVSRDAARLFKAAARNGGGISGNLLAMESREGIVGIRPMLNRASAESQGREWWADLLMRLPRGTPTVAIITDEARKRLWLDARASVVGSAWTLYLHSGDDARAVTVDIGRLRECLALCTEIYTLGFNKQDLATGLFGPARRTQVQALGFTRVAEYERKLSPWRGSDELAVAVAVVQPAPELLPTLAEPPCPLRKSTRSHSIPTASTSTAISTGTSAQAELFG